MPALGWRAKFLQSFNPPMGPGHCKDAHNVDYDSAAKLRLKAALQLAYELRMMLGYLSHQSHWRRVRSLQAEKQTSMEEEPELYKSDDFRIYCLKVRFRVGEACRRLQAHCLVCRIDVLYFLSDLEGIRSTLGMWGQGCPLPVTAAAALRSPPWLLLHMRISSFC